MNIRELIESTAEKHADRNYIYFEDYVLSFKSFNEMVNKVGNGLLDLGFRKGDKVCLMMPNCPEFLYAWLGANKIGAIMVPINTALTGEAARYIVDHSDAKAIFVNPQYLPTINEIRDKCPNLRTIICTGEGSTRESIPFSDFIKNRSVTLAEVDISDEDVAGIIYTSGTTGNPKGVMQSHRAYVTTGQAYVSPYWTACTSEDRIMMILPLFHANAQFYSAMGSLVAGIPLIILDKFSTSRFWDQTRQYKGTVVNIIGPIERYLMSQPPTQEDADNPLRIMWGPFDSQGHVFKRRVNIACIGGYSLTESPLGFVDPLEEVAKRGDNYDIVRCMGYPSLYKHPDSRLRTAVRIVDNDDHDVPDGTVGELLIQSTAVMKGYYKDPDKTKETMQGGWLHTGDNIVKSKEDGLCYFVDRKKDIIRVKGENVSSQDVEGVINSHPKVLESACIPIPSGYGDDYMKACIVLQPEETLPPEELIEWCKQKLAPFKVPRYVEYRDRLPKTPTMRIQKNILKTEKADLTEGCYDSWQKR